MNVKDWNDIRSFLKQRLAQIDEQLKPPSRAAVHAGCSKYLTTEELVKLRVERALVLKDLAATRVLVRRTGRLSLSVTQISCRVLLVG